MKALVVSDNSDMRNTVATVARSAQYPVTQAPFDDASSLRDVSEYACAVVDATTPAGRQFVRNMPDRWGRSNPALRIVVLLGDDDNTLKLKECRVDFVVRVPFEAESLVNALGGQQEAPQHSRHAPLDNEDAPAALA